MSKKAEASDKRAEASPAVLDKHELAARWHHSPKYIERMAGNKVIRFFRIGRKMLFRLRDIEEFEKERLTRTRSF